MSRYNERHYTADKIYLDLKEINTGWKNNSFPSRGLYNP